MATVILVRHGRTTANTAGVLAGRAAGVQLDDVGPRPGGARRRSGSPGAARRRRDQPARALPADRAADRGGAARAQPRPGHGARASPSATTATGRAGPLKDAGQGDRCGDRADPAVRGDVPRRRVDGRDAGPRGRRRTPPRRRRRGRARRRRGVGGGQPRRRHQVGARRRARACTSTCSSGSHVDPASVSIVRYTATRPFVLATNTHAGDLSWLAPPPPKRRRPRRRRRPTPPSAAARAGPSAAVIGWPHGPARPRVRPAGALRRRHRRPARTAHVLPPGPQRQPAVSVALEKQQVAVLAERIDELLDEVMTSERHRGDRPGAWRRSTSTTPSRSSSRSRRSSGPAR